MNQLSRLGRLIVSLNLLMSMAAHAQVVNDAAFWTGLDYDTPLSDAQPIHFDLMTQLRFTDARSTINEIFFRPSIYYKFENGFRVGFGYDAIPSYPDTGRYIEQRVWPQMQQVITIKQNNTLTLRSRLEFRFRDTELSSATRFRQRIDYSRKLGSSSWSLNIFDEIFFGFKRPDWVSQTFVDQNRIFIGIAKKINRYVQLDAGYLSIFRPGEPSRLSHIPVLAIEFGVDKQPIRIRSI